MHELAERVLAGVRLEKLLRAGDRVGVAVSGGIDSVAILRLLMELRQELGIVLSAVHFNHKLRGAESSADRDFVAALAREHGLEFYCASGDAAQLAGEQHSGLEAAARELRYGFFRELLGPGEGLETQSRSRSEAQSSQTFDRSAGSATPPNAKLDKIATGHTLDDQAETVLMRLIRGTGMRGLGGIHPRIVVEDEDGEVQGEIVRPLLGILRRELEKYLADLKQPWREDSSNADSKFTRNRLRKLVMPLLEKEFNPAVFENFAELAEIARDEEDYWDNEVSGWLGTVVQWSEPVWARDVPDTSFVQIQPPTPKPPEAPSMDLRLRLRVEASPWLVMNASLSRPWLLTEPRAVQRRVVKAIGQEAGIPFEFKHVEEILRFAEEDGPSGKELSLPLNWKVRREPEALIFLTPDLRMKETFADYEYRLEVPGRAVVAELGLLIEVLRFTAPVTAKSQIAEYNPQQLLCAELLAGPLIVRNWRPGDKFWPAHTKAPKKIKELLQERHVAQPERRLWPVVESGSEIVWMRGFPVPAQFCARAGQEAVLIREVPWADEPGEI